MRDLFVDPFTERELNRYSTQYVIVAERGRIHLVECIFLLVLIAGASIKILEYNGFGGIALMGVSMFALMFSARNLIASNREIAGMNRRFCFDGKKFFYARVLPRDLDFNVDHDDGLAAALNRLIHCPDCQSYLRKLDAIGRTPCYREITSLNRREREKYDIRVAKARSVKKAGSL